MATIDFITQLFSEVDDKLTQSNNNQKHSQANLYPSEVVTIALLFVLKGVGNRAFYRWIANNYKVLFPKLPQRTRLFRLFNSHRHLTDLFMEVPSLMGVIDTYGIELIHPRREGRFCGQIGKKGISNQRWIVGGKLCVLVNHLGLIVDWDCATANVYDGSCFQHIVDNVSHQMVVFADEGFAKVDWQPVKLAYLYPWTIER
ncbi:transposase [Candidatus Poribacteria bacterium]|nr:transposase [Candidatus Poribacteria bacterium]